YAELDLTWLTWEPTKLAAEAEALAKRLPLFTAHLPPSHFHQADLARFVGFIDALEPVGIHIFNAHFMETRSAPRISPETKASWFADLVRAASDRGAVVTVENVDEPPEVMRTVLDAVSDLRYCLDVGHAHLDNRTDGARIYLAALADRLGLVHMHDNHGGHGETGDEHLPFGKGTIDLERDAKALKARGYDGPVTLEVFKGIRDDRRACLRKIRRWTKEQTADHADVRSRPRACQTDARVSAPLVHRRGMGDRSLPRARDAGARRHRRDDLSKRPGRTPDASRRLGLREGRGWPATSLARRGMARSPGSRGPRDFGDPSPRRVLAERVLRRNVAVPKESGHHTADRPHRNEDLRWRAVSRSGDCPVVQGQSLRSEGHPGFRSHPPPLASRAASLAETCFGNVPPGPSVDRSALKTY